MGLHWIDGLIISIYLATLTLIGIWFYSRQKSLGDFFLAKKGLSWVPIGLSLMAALNSGIDYLTQPSAVMRYGYLLVVIPSLLWIVLYFYVTKITLPLFRRLQIYSAYEYLEKRFNVKIRTLSAIIFVLWRLCWMGAALYVPCLAINSITNGALPLVPTVITLGSVATLYCMLGGFRAVVWTEVAQFCVMFTGIAVTIIMIMSKFSGNIFDVFSFAAEQGKIMVTSTPPEKLAIGFGSSIVNFLRTDMNAVALALSFLTFRMASFTADQVMVQRFAASRSGRDAKRSFVINAVSDTVWMLCLGFVGLCLLFYCNQSGAFSDVPRDEVFPRFIGDFFPVGVSGLVIAAIFAASLSSVDAAVNSCSSVIIVDIYDRLILNRTNPQRTKSEEQQKKQVFVSRIATLLIGIAAIVLASNVGKIGSLYEIMHKVINLFTGPIFGIFLLGMFTRRANSLGVLTGGILGTLLTICVAFFTDVSFLYTPIFGFLSTFIIGYLFSMMVWRNSESNPKWTFKGVMESGEERE